MTVRNSLAPVGVVLTILVFALTAYGQTDLEAMGVSVRDFGAVGDGKTDDSGAFQRAIDSGRGDIFVPRGRYRFRKTVVAYLDRTGPLSIMGSGTATIIMAGSGPALKLVGAHGGSANIRIIGEGQPRASFAKGELRGGNVTITGNILSDVQINVHLRKVRGVTIVGNTLWKGYAHDLLVEGSSSVVVGPNVFDRNPRYHYGDGAEANRGLVFRDCDDVILAGLLIDSVWRKEAGLVLNRCRNLNVSNCTIIDCDNCGILMDDVRDTIVSGCAIRNRRKEQAGTSALVVKKGEGNFIVNNVLSGRLEIAPGSATLTNNLEK